jgi:hypothetical protein
MNANGRLCIMDQLDPIALCRPEGGFSFPHHLVAFDFHHQRSSAVSSELIRGGRFYRDSPHRGFRSHAIGGFIRLRYATGCPASARFHS